MPVATSTARASQCTRHRWPVEWVGLRSKRAWAQFCGQLLPSSRPAVLFAVLADAFTTAGTPSRCTSLFCFALFCCWAVLTLYCALIFTNREARGKQEVGGTAQKKTELSNARPKGGGAVRMRQSRIQPALNNSIRLYSPLSNLEIQRSRSACNCRLSACAKKVLHLGSKLNHFGFRGFNRIALACNACW